MPPASSTAARCRPTTRLGSVIGSRGYPKAKDWCRLHLLARHLQPLSSRLLDQQSEPFKTSSQTSTPPTSSLQAKLKTGAVGADSTKKSTRSPPATPISWSRADHPEVMPSPGSYALVLDATLATERRAARFSRVLIDGGSSINILYRDTMEKLNIKTKQLMPSRTVFHGIVPGLSCSPIGKIKMDVLFGDKDHFRREAVWFEVVDLESPYHALLGRPALSKFMAVPHYAYLKMKIPSSKGIITIAGDYKKSLCGCQQPASRVPCNC